MSEYSVISLLGLFLDLVGFIFLFREVSFSHQFEKDAIDINLLNIKANRFIHDSNKMLDADDPDENLKEHINLLRERKTAAEVANEKMYSIVAKRSLGRRKASLWLGGALVFLGFALQLVGTYTGI